MDLLTQISKIIPKISSSACAKPIYADEINYVCNTCSGATSVFCPSCFYNGDHKDHDYALQMNLIGLCDCGDDSSYIQESCCINHPLKIEQIFTNVTLAQFSTAFDLIYQFINESLNEIPEQQISQIYEIFEDSPILLRIFILVLFFSKMQKEFIFQNIENIDILMDVIQQNNFATHLLINLEQFELIDLFTQDFFFRVFSITLIANNLEKLIIWPNKAIQTMAVQVLTEPKTQIFAAKFQIYSKTIAFLIQQINQQNKLDIKFLSVYELFYQFQQISQPNQIKYILLYDKALLFEILKLHEKVNCFGKINPENCGENYNDFLEDINVYIYFIKFIINPFYSICDYSDIDIGVSDRILNRLHIKADIRDQISIKTDFYSSLNFQIAAELVQTYLKFQNHQDNFLNLYPNCYVQNFILNQIFRLNLNKFEYFSKLSQQLQMSVKELSTLLIYPQMTFLLIKQKILSQNFYKKHLYELSLIVNFAAHDPIFSNHWFKLVNFIQKSIAFTETTFLSENDEIKLEIYNQILFNAIVLDEQLFLRIYLSLQFISLSDLKLSHLLDKTGFRKSIVLNAAKDVFSVQQNVKPLKSSIINLRTSNYIEPSMSANPDSIWQKMDQDNLIDRMFNSVNQDNENKEIITPAFLEYIDNLYLSSSFSQKIIIMRIFCIMNYKSKIQVQQVDQRLIPLEVKYFDSFVLSKDKISMKERLQKLKRQNIASCLMNPPNIVKNDNPCSVCHQNVDNKIKFLSIKNQQIGASVYICNHVCHPECVIGLQSCPICGIKISAIIGKEIQKINEFQSFSEFFSFIYNGIFDFYEFFASCSDIDHDFKIKVLQRAVKEIQEINNSLENKLEIDFTFKISEENQFFADVFQETLTEQVYKFEVQKCDVCEKLIKPSFRICLGCGTKLCGICGCYNCARDATWDVISGSINIGGRLFPAPYRDSFGQLGGVQGSLKTLDRKMLKRLIQEIIE